MWTWWWEVASLPGLSPDGRRKFSGLGFARDMAADAPICRWRFRVIEADLMPTSLRAFSVSPNRWYPLAVATAERRTLPSGVSIRLIAAPLFVATKFDCIRRPRRRGSARQPRSRRHHQRGGTGVRELSDEIARANEELRAYLSGKCDSLLAMPEFMNYLPGMLHQDATLPERVAEVAGAVAAHCEPERGLMRLSGFMPNLGMIVPRLGFDYEALARVFG
jgi:hypothetical protein